MIGVLATGLALLALRVAGVIDWPWWLCSLPLWGAALVLAWLPAICTLVGVVADMRDERRRKADG